MCRTLLSLASNSRSRLLMPQINRLSLLVVFALFVQAANAQFTVDFDVTEPTCWGQPNGSVTAIPSGGTSPYTYMWNTGDTGPTITDLMSGLYTVTVTDDDGVIVIKNVTVTEPEVVNVDLTANTCEIPIIITATGSGGLPPYTYNWSTGQNGSVISVPNPGTYCVTMTDQNLCGAVECITVTVNPLNVTVQTNDLTCADLDDGQVIAMPTGGTPPYTYIWSNGVTTASQTGLPPGTYTVTVTDAAGCMDEATGTVQSPPPLTVVATGVNPDCAGDNDGSASASASGGTPPYTYTWSTGTMGPNLFNIGQGTYTVTVTDANGCTATDQVDIVPVSDLSVTAVATNESCPNEDDGSITATPINGVPPYTYLWSNGAGNMATINNLAPGSYSVTVIDGAGCSDFATAVVSAADPLIITVTGNNVSICDGSNGSATANIIQGTGPFTFEWSDGQDTQTATNLSGGTYSVTVTDANGCTQTGSILITTPPPVMVTIIADDEVCPGESTGSAMAVASGGTPPYTYLWNTGATTMNIDNLPAGTYTVTVTDAAQCTDEASVTITESPEISVTIDGTETVCGAENDGEATAIVVGGVPPYTYLWSEGSNTQTITDLPESSYSVTVTDALGCSAVAEIDIDIIDDFVLDIVIQNVLCFGESTGSILAEGWGGTPPYDYQWSNGVTGTPLLENIPVGNYSVTVTDQNGCVLIESFNITVPPLLIALADGSSLVCPGETTGEATATGIGGTPPYSYLWSTSDTTQTITGLSAGTYTVTITDDNDCEAEASVTLEEAEGVTVVVTGTEIVCGAGNTGTATANVSTGTPPFDYLWSTGETTPTITNLAEGIYGVTVTDANGCTASDAISIDVIDDLDINATVTNVLCFGEATGEIMVTPVGGTAPYTYLWSTGATTADLQNLTAGAYSVTVTDANDCTVSETFTITEPPLLSVTIDGTPTVCPGESTGMLTATATGGTTPYSYEWSNGETTPTINNLPAGIYTVTVTDDNNCTATESFTITESPELMLQVSGTEIVCGDGNTGEATVSAIGGVPPYEYDWSNGESTETIDDLVEGIYIVTVTDANGCTAIGQVEIDVIDDFQIMTTPMDVLCFGGNTGRILVTPSGGASPYTYLWSTSATTNEITNLTAGTYDVTVTDANGCEVFQSVTINEPPQLNLQLNSTDVTCFGFDDGTITSTVSGGTPPYVYDWSNGESTADLTGLAPGTYTLTVTDLNGCTATATATVEQPEEIIVNITGQDLFCFGDNSGFASSSVSGGTPPYTYEWSTGATTTDIFGLAAGTYGLTVTDANGCTGTGSVTINQPDELTVSLDVMDIFCDAAADGSITAIPAGGTAPYTYEWSNGETTQTIGNLPPGTYTVTVTDINECDVVGQATVEEFPGLMLTPIATTPNCFGEMTGAAAVIVMGGTPPFEYLWDNAATTPELLNIPAGSYTVTVTDAVGCTGVETVGVAEPALLTAQVASSDVVDVSCNNFSDGQATITVDGGTPPYTYEWSSGQTTAMVDNLSAGMYTATVTDVNGCEATVDVTINEPPALDLDVMAVVGNTCEDTADGSANASVSGGTPPYTYEWDTGATTANISNLMAGTYSVTVTDANECTAEGTVTINAFDTPTCSIMVTNEITSLGDDGEATITVNGGTPPFTYMWSNGQTGQTATNLVPGDYTATVTDDNGCTTSCMVTLAPPAQIGDYVWQDDDRDGIQDPNEDGIEGVMVILQIPGESNPTNIDTTFTDADGFYFFNVIPGDYKVLFINPGGLTFTDPNQGSNDALDSDVDPTMGMTGVYTIGPGEINLTIDAGLFPKCDNITDPGEIGPDQFLCGPGNDPDPILNIESPSGGSGAIEYLWMQSTIPGPFNIQTWNVIPGATGPSYDPGPLSETTYFARCARRECCTIYLETNIVTIEVGSVAVADIQGPDFICVDELTTFFAAGAGAGADINWTFGPGMSPQTATGTPVDVMISSPGIYTISLEVTENGCTSFDEETITGTNSPLYCAGLLPIDVEPISANANVNGGDDAVRVSWRMEDVLEGYSFEVQYSENSENFTSIGAADEPMAHLGAMRYYEHMHMQPKLGHNYYRVKATAPNGEEFFSEIEDAVFLGDSKIAMLYPNPVDDMAILELFETFGEDVDIEIVSTNGARMKSIVADKDAERVELNVGDYPSGTYLVKVRYSKSGLKVLKLIKE